MKNLDILKDHPIKVFFYYCIPGVLALVAVSSAQTVDAIFVGNYSGSASLAAINLVIPFFYFIFGFGVMIVTGSAVRCGKYIGEEKSVAASAIFTKTMIVLCIACLIVTFTGLVIPDEIVRLLGANDVLMAESSLYLRYISAFILFFLISFALSVFVRVDGRPILSSVGIIAGALGNLVLDGWLVAYLDMGVKGAAIGTGASQIISFFILLSHFFSSKNSLKFIFNAGGWKEIFQSCYNGLSELTNELSVGIVVLLFNWIMISRLGVEGVAAFSVINYTLAFGLMLSYGISDSILPIISTNFGAQLAGRIRYFLITALTSVFVLGTVFFFLLAMLPEQMIDIFLEPDEITTAQLALEFTDIVKWAFLFSGLNMVLSAYHTAMHKPMESVAIALIRSLILPVGAIIILPKYLGNLGIYLAIPLSEFISLLVALILFLKNRPSALVTHSFRQIANRNSIHKN